MRGMYMYNEMFNKMLEQFGNNVAMVATVGLLVAGVFAIGCIIYDTLIDPIDTQK